jgi:hypothetical protein
MSDTFQRSFSLHSSPRLLVGVVFVLFGAALLIGRLDIVDAGYVLRFWPVLLIAIGVQQFFNPRVGRNGERIFPVHGIIWMGIGGLLLLNTLHILRGNVWQLFWPAMLIVLGVRLITRGGSHGLGRRARRLRVGVDAREEFVSDTTTGGQGATQAGGFATSAGAGDSIDSGGVVAILGGVNRISAAVPFEGTEVTAFMGGAEIDLRRAILAPGAEAVLDVFIVIGGCELKIPPTWVVSAPLIAVMGGVEDKRVIPATSVVQDATTTATASPRLIVRGFVMLGGLTIRS